MLLLVDLLGHLSLTGSMSILVWKEIWAKLRDYGLQPSTKPYPRKNTQLSHSLYVMWKSKVTPFIIKINLIQNHGFFNKCTQFVPSRASSCFVFILASLQKLSKLYLVSIYFCLRLKKICKILETTNCKSLLTLRDIMKKGTKVKYSTTCYHRVVFLSL